MNYLGPSLYGVGEEREVRIRLGGLARRRGCGRISVGHGNTPVTRVAVFTTCPVMTGRPLTSPYAVLQRVSWIMGEEKGSRRKCLKIKHLVGVAQLVKASDCGNNQTQKNPGFSGVFAFHGSLRCP